MIQNKRSYLYLVLSIALSFFTIVMLTVCIDNIIKNSSGTLLHNIQYIYRSIQTIFWFTGILFIIYQYYTTMKSNITQYSIIKSLGATQTQIMRMILIQTALLLILTLPIGLYIDFSFMNFISDILKNDIFDNEFLQIMKAPLIYYLLSVVITIIVVIFGIDIEKTIRELPPTGHS